MRAWLRRRSVTNAELLVYGVTFVIVSALIRTVLS